jgi:hypothetical protein
MCLAAGSGPVAVKHRTVELVNRVTSLSVVLAVKYTEMDNSSTCVNTITLENCVNNISLQRKMSKLKCDMHGDDPSIIFKYYNNIHSI